MENNNDFLSKIIQIVGILFNILLLISQYFLRDEFSKLLMIDKNNSYYPAFTVVALILGSIVIVGLYSIRYSLLNRWYICRDQYKKYLSYLEKRRLNQNNTEIEIEPFFLDGSRFAFIAIVFSIIFFVVIFVTSDPLYKSIFYLLLILGIIVSLSIFLMLLYLQGDWIKKEDLNNKKIEEKIKNFLSPEFQETERIEDYSNVLNPIVKIKIKVKNRNYLVFVNKNDPNKYFSINPN